MRHRRDLVPIFLPDLCSYPSVSGSFPYHHISFLVGQTRQACSRLRAFAPAVPAAGITLRMSMCLFTSGLTSKVTSLARLSALRGLSLLCHSLLCPQSLTRLLSQGKPGADLKTCVYLLLSGVWLVPSSTRCSELQSFR